MGFEKERERKPENLVVYQVVGSFSQYLPTLRPGTEDRACPRAPGIFLGLARLGHSLNQLCG